MTLNDLPIEVQNELNAKRADLHKTEYCNTAWRVSLVNKEGTRYFLAYRRNDFSRYSGGSIYGWWVVRYGKVLWDRRKQPLGNDFDYFWVLSGKTFGKSKNGTEIPKEVHTKKEVLEIARKIGIFEI